MLIAIKDDKEIKIGMTIKESYVNMEDADIFQKENVPYWTIKDKGICHIFADTLSFSVDLLRYKEDIFKDITDGMSIIKNVIPKIRKVLDEYLCYSGKNAWNNQLLIVKNKKMFLIDTNLIVIEVDNQIATDYEPYALGTLEEYKDLEKDKRIIESYKIIEKMRNCKLFPIMLIDPKKEKIEYYNELGELYAI